jgi:hypothetical protein
MEPKDVCIASALLKDTLHLPDYIVSDTVIDFMGLTIVQVSQNQAAVISDPQVILLLIYFF